VETTKLKLRIHSSLESRWKKRHVLWCEPLMMTYSVRMWEGEDRCLSHWPTSRTWRM